MKTITEKILAYLDSNNEIQLKIVPENMRNIVTNKINWEVLEINKLQELFENFNEWEQFDRMKHMSLEEREKSNKMKGKLKTKDKLY